MLRQLHEDGVVPDSERTRQLSECRSMVCSVIDEIIGERHASGIQRAGERPDGKD